MRATPAAPHQSVGGDLPPPLPPRPPVAPVHRIKKLERELAAKNRMLQEADNRTQNFMMQKRSVDEQLVQLREHVEEVERAKNMHGVTARFKVMLGKIQAREQELHKARLELSNRTLDLNTLHEIAKRLAVEAGHPADVDLAKIYPELDIQRSIRGAVASWRARCEELEQQNEALEDERLSLLAKARERAQLVRGHARAARPRCCVTQATHAPVLPRHPLVALHTPAARVDRGFALARHAPTRATAGQGPEPEGAERGGRDEGGRVRPEPARGPRREALRRARVRPVPAEQAPEEAAGGEGGGDRDDHGAAEAAGEEGRSASAATARR